MKRSYAFLFLIDIEHQGSFQNTAQMDPGISPTVFCTVGSDAYQYLCTLVLAGMTGSVVAMIRSRGRYLANRPRLCKMD